MRDRSARSSSSEPLDERGGAERGFSLLPRQLASFRLPKPARDLVCLLFFLAIFCVLAVAVIMLVVWLL